MEEVFFLAHKADDGRYIAFALGAEAATLDELRINIRKAVRHNFAPGPVPSSASLNFVKNLRSLESELLLLAD
jgi:hypothetical protein